MSKKIFLIFIFISSFLIGNPRNPIEVSANIAIEVVKPIEIISRKNIKHSVFKGSNEDIRGIFSLEIRASSKQTLRFIYPKILGLIDNNTNKIILLETDYILGYEWATTTDNNEGSKENRVEISSPKYGHTRIYEVPYRIYLSGEEAQGEYEGVINIQIEYI